MGGVPHQIFGLLGVIAYKLCSHWCCDRGCQNFDSVQAKFIKERKKKSSHQPLS